MDNLNNVSIQTIRQARRHLIIQRHAHQHAGSSLPYQIADDSAGVPAHRNLHNFGGALPSFLESARFRE